MNKPFSPLAAADQVVRGYDHDPYGWAIEQAAHIRARQIERIDWDNIAEELEGMARSERRAAISMLRVTLMHILKWRHQPLFRSRSWQNSILEHLRRFDHEMSENPSLKPHLPAILDEAYRLARAEAAQETGLLMTSFPADPPSWDEIRAPLEP